MKDKMFAEELRKTVHWICKNKSYWEYITGSTG